MGNGTCSYPGYQCSLPCADKSDYCMRHVLEDTNTIFKQCTYIFPDSSHKCFRPGSKRDKDGSCYVHAAQNFRRKHDMTKCQTRENPEICLQKLSHHRMLPMSSTHTPFPDPSNVPSTPAKLMEYKVDGDDDEMEDIDVMSHPKIEDDSDIDIGSDIEALDHIGSFTSEEISRIYLEKLYKLKKLYMGQFKELEHQMKENKKQYILALRKEKESMMSIHDQPKDSMDEKQAYEELKALGRHHILHGKESLLKAQQIQKESQLKDGGITKVSLSVGCVKCIYSEGSWKCKDQSVPLSKFCFKHILQDSTQVLFKKCDGNPDNPEDCSTSVPKLPYLPTCVYHLPPPSFIPVSDSLEKTETTSTMSVPVVNLNDSSAFVVTEVPPEDVMEGDSIKNN